MNSILMGDTNLIKDEDQYPLPSEESPQSPNNPPIIDVYYMSLPMPLERATYCGRTNKHIKNTSIQSRLDRIYVKIKRNSLKVHFYGLTGTFTQPSDHFGVFSQIEF